MIDVRHLERVATQDLRYGLYIAELDRPWDEVPVMFQGFVLKSARDLKTLQKHCEYVFVERERSQPDAYDAAVAAAAPTKGNVAKAAAGKGGRYPEKSQLAARVKAAVEQRVQSLDFLNRSLADVRLGRAVSSREARQVVEALADQVTNNADAMLWLTSLKKKDAYSSLHSVNVAVLTLAFGMHLGIRGQSLETLGLGALLHDVGKVRLPSKLLNKPEPLSPEEWTRAKGHAEVGVEVLQKSGGFSKEVLDIVGMHHERLDGSGYPNGLRGSDFPYAARIVALANAYDSLTTNRPYRSARPADEALQELYNQRESSYGSELVQEFIQCIGIFPVGSLVKLDNGALGIVVGTSPDNRLRPTVLLVQTPEGEPYQKRVLLNLASEPEPDAEHSARHIRDVVNPAEHDIDIGAIVAFEFGIDW